MPRSSQRLLAALAALAFLPAAAIAQNVAATPTFGTVSLSAGFSPDPQIRSVTAGGNNYTTLAGCNAYIHAAAPDLDLNYRAGSFPLTLEARSGMDVTLLVNAPDGSWYCNDDGGNGTDALLTFSAPQSGQYNIWVGTYRAQSGTLPEAQVYITELTGGGISSFPVWLSLRKDNFSAETLPTLDEISDPDAWVRRVHGPPAARLRSRLRSDGDN